jgi:hypothetical protein
MPSQENDVFGMNINMSLDCKSESKIYELREDLRESFEMFSKQLDVILDGEEDELHTKVYDVLYNLKNSYYPHKQKFSDIYFCIQESILLTDDEIDDIFGEMEFDLENIFFSNDGMFDVLIEVIGDYEKSSRFLKQIRQAINEKFLSFDNKLCQLYEKINT